MVSFRTLPLPGAHITTLTSLANFKPVQNDMSQTHSLSSSEYEDDQQPGIDLADYDVDDNDDARQAENLHSANQAYDMAMATLADENPTPNCKPQWPSNVHASHASFEDWAATSHDNSSSAPFRSQDAFSFSEVQQPHSVHNGSSSPSSESGIQSIWRTSVPSNEASPLPVNVQAVQQLFQDFLSSTGLDYHFEVKAKPSRTTTDLQDEKSVTVQSALPCGRFMKLQLS